MRQRRRKPTVRNRAPIFIGAAIVVVVLLILSSLPSGYPEPQGLATEKSFSKYSDTFFEYEVTRYASGAEVTPEVSTRDEGLSVGVSADPEDLRFGSIPIGENNFAKRFIELSNLNYNEAKVELVARGGIEPFVTFSPDEVVLGPDGKATVEVFFRTADAVVGEYVGEIDVVIKRPKFEFARGFW